VQRSPEREIGVAGSDLRNSLANCWLTFQRWAPGLLSARFTPHLIASKKAAGLLIPGLMPRANRYLVPGNFYHLTHRCHNRKFLFKVYIELNMVRAGVVPHPAEWPWCSYTESIGVGSRAFVEAIAEKITHRQQPPQNATRAIPQIRAVVPPSRISRLSSPSRACNATASKTGLR
jgi:hypothetical protein